MSLNMNHESQYEGWDEDKEEETVSRFDKVDYQWVTLYIEDIPQDVIDERQE
ncbi:hypothetical protein [Haloarcula amylovorans]|uniref:hypothetical protein n=1 Tax=Haloarcula amylovorans TaxID=2562280 RepID=UPI001431724F|nr:hypothetical protein [Halomicroarcula amylolytica]